jgi:hypothetical protein
MDDYMLMEYLKSKGIEGMSEHEFVHKFKEFMNKYGTPVRYNRGGNWEDTMGMKYGRNLDSRKYNDLEYYDMYAEYPEYATYSEIRDRKPYSNFRMMRGDTMDYPINNMRGISRMNDMHMMKEDHFSESEAMHIVEGMHHNENGKKYFGEKFSMTKAKEVQDRYRGVIPNDITVPDIYVAINAQYHDYEELFKTWFGSNIDSKIIESAITFWFKDDDYTKGSKLIEYFK